MASKPRQKARNKGESIATASAVKQYRRQRWNPLRTLTPESLSRALDAFEYGDLREFAMLAETVAQRDDVIKSVKPKREKSIAHRDWQILKHEKSPAADKHKEVLEDFWRNVRVGVPGMPSGVVTDVNGNQVTIAGSHSQPVPEQFTFRDDKSSPDTANFYVYYPRTIKITGLTDVSATVSYRWSCLQTGEARTINVGNINLSPEGVYGPTSSDLYNANSKDTRRVTNWGSSGAPRVNPLNLEPGEYATTVFPALGPVIVERGFGSNAGVINRDNIAAALLKYDLRLAASGATAPGGIPLYSGPGGVGTATPFGVGEYDDSSASSPFTLPEILTVKDTEGNPIPAGYDWFLTNGEPQNWWKDQVGDPPAPQVPHVMGVITARIYSVNVHDFGDSETKPCWLESMGGQLLSYLHAPGTTHSVFWTTVTVRVAFVNQTWATDTALYRAEDYSYVSPPVGLAANMLAAQNWLPHEGTVTLVQDDPLALSYTGCVLNVLGGLPEWATMKTLVRGVTVDLMTGRSTLQVGSPARIAFQDMIGRFRRTGSENIVFVKNKPLAGVGG